MTDSTQAPLVCRCGEMTAGLCSACLMARDASQDRHLAEQGMSEYAIQLRREDSMSDYRETLAREWTKTPREGCYHSDPWCDCMIAHLAALLRSRDERAVRIVEEVRERPPTIDKNPTGGLTPPAYMATVNAVCDEIKRRLEADDAVSVASVFPGAADRQDDLAAEADDE